MLCGELIRKLGKFNPKADVTLTTSEDICLSFIFKDTDTGEVLTEKTTKQIFIEPTDSCPMCTSEYMNGDIMWCSFYDCACRDVEECYEFEEFHEP